MITTLITVVTLSLVTATVSLTLSGAEVFASLRRWCLKWFPWIGKLMKCPYCVSHYVSLALVFYYQPRVVQSDFWLVDMVVSVFLVVALATLFSWPMRLAFEWRSDAQRELENENRELAETLEKLIKEREGG
jgi:hypothetical protein